MLPITTERLVVRPFTTTDLDDFLAYQSHPDVRRHLQGQPHTDEAAASYVAAQAALDDEQRDAWHDWAVEHRGLGRVIGNLGVYLPAASPAEGDLGFQFSPDFHGQGFAREAATALVGALRSRWGLTRITASCDEANAASARLLLALGFDEVVDETEGRRSFELLS
ncbi:GNAT family N-acetyltransferase [Nocardioides oleivorans]|uniref:GNAT family N-acetyltransferase n=1 Tax=Nocardioides oleivorans TaxID=273676 RepID=UPI0013EB46AC|nr:GNAT family N-acetyltransferase [Nocardioides oleivorans]